MAENTSSSPEALRAKRIADLIAKRDKVSDSGVKAAIEERLKKEQDAASKRAGEVFNVIDQRLEAAVDQLRELRNAAKAQEKIVDALDTAYEQFTSGDKSGDVDNVRSILKAAGIAVTI